MFSGIIEATAKIESVQELDRAVRIQIQRPTTFDDIKLGDSIAVNGACLTVEKIGSNLIDFTLAAESLKVLHWSESPWVVRPVNLERSLRFGDRIHGHIVSGHVEQLGQVLRSEAEGESWFLDIQVDSSALPYIWKKGSITLHGVSLTVNEVNDHVVSVCLIPETIKRTNLVTLKKNDLVNVEFDWMAKALVLSFQQQLKDFKNR